MQPPASREDVSCRGNNSVAAAFFAETGRRVPPAHLVAKLTALRKRGLLPKVGGWGYDKKDEGFSDIDQAIG
jgi:hypothetical protein